MEIQTKTEYESAVRGRVFYAASPMEALVRVMRWFQAAEEMGRRISPLDIRFDEVDAPSEKEASESSIATVFYEETTDEAPGG